jgi:hypothetical protein
MSTYLALKITFSPETSSEGVCPCIHKALKGRYRCSKLGNKSTVVLTDNHIELLLSWSTYGMDAKTRVFVCALAWRSVLLINAGLMEMGFSLYVLPSESFKGGPRPSALLFALSSSRTETLRKGLFYALLQKSCLVCFY